MTILPIITGNPTLQKKTHVLFNLFNIDYTTIIVRRKEMQKIDFILEIFDKCEAITVLFRNASTNNICRSSNQSAVT